MNRRVVITGTGVVSPCGFSRGDLHQALCAGQLGLSASDSLSCDLILNPLVGEVSSFAAADYLGTRGLRALNRTAQLLTVAAQLAIEDSKYDPELLPTNEVGLVVGTAFCSAHTISQFDLRALKEGPSRASPLDFANTVINAATGQTAVWHKLTGLNSTISAGNASGVKALAYAIDMIRSGLSNAVLAGGVDELCYETLVGFYNSGTLCNSPGKGRPKPIPFDVRRNGFCLAEGAALLMLEDAESAEQRNANVLGEIKGYGASFDAQAALESEREVTSCSRAMGRAIRIALEDANLQPSDIGSISASANGSPLHDLAEGKAIQEVFNGQSSRIPVTAVKSMIGESLGASGALQSVAAVASIEDGKVPGIAGLEEIEADLELKISSAPVEFSSKHTLVNAMGMDGNCCSLVIGSC